MQESIKKEDLVLMQEKITKIVQKTTVSDMFIEIKPLWFNLNVVIFFQGTKYSGRSY